MVSGRVVATTISPAAVLRAEWVREAPQLGLEALLVLDLEVGQRGLVNRVPVDEALAAVDEAVLPHELDEVLGHRALQVGVEGEPLAGPVARHTEAPQLVADGAAGHVAPARTFSRKPSRPSVR